MNLDRAVLAFAGALVLVSLVLARYVSPHWVWLTVFVGLNLVQASISGFCPAAKIFKACGVKEGSAFK